MVRPVQATKIRRISNRCMVVGIVALCITVLFMLTVNNIKSSQQKPSSIAGWLQAARKHVQAFSTGPNRKGSTDSATVHFSEPLRRPEKQTKIHKPALYPEGFRLSDLENFTFVVNNDVCGDDVVDLVMVVTSDTRKPSWRAAIRSALPQSTLDELRIRRVFLLAQLPPAPRNVYDRRAAAVQAENHEHGDLVSGAFQDAYRNLTYKHLMGLHWATAYCPQAQYIIKMDDDIVLDVFQLRERLATAPRNLTAIGAVFAGTGPIRDPKSKWYVTETEFAGDTYPTYLSGWMYAITPDAAARLVAAAARLPFFWVDDAFVTGVVRQRAVSEVRLLDMDQLWATADGAGATSSPFTMEAACVYECAAEPEASRGRCDTLVGPTWSNHLLLRLFFKQAEYCYRRRCRRRRRMPAICHDGDAPRRGGIPQTMAELGDVGR